MKSKGKGEHMNVRIFAVLGFAFLVLFGTFAASTDKLVEKARNDRFKALKKECGALVNKDFTGGFANYWHDSIDQARAKYEVALADPDFTVQQKVELYALIAQCRLEATCDIEGAMKDFDAAIALAGSDEKAKATALANKAKIVAQVDGSAWDPKPLKETSENLVERKICALFKEGGLKKVEAELPGFIAEEQAKADADASLKKKPKRYDEVWRYVTDRRRRKERGGILREPGARRFFVALMEKAPESQRPNAESLFIFTRDVPELSVRRFDFAQRTIEMAKNPKNRVKLAIVKEAEFYIRLFTAKNDVAKAIAVCTTTNKVETAANIAKVARDFLKQGDEASARAAWTAREKFVPRHEQPVLDVPYWEDAPHDIRGILESDLYVRAKKGCLNRRYGDNLQFLIETDSAILGREMTTDNGESFRPTELFAYWDAAGVKILLRSFAKDMKGINSGFDKLGGYELYLATGVDDPYHCLLVDPSEGSKVGDAFVTQYDNVTGYRQVKYADGTLDCQTLYLKDGGAVLLSIPWYGVFAAAPWKHPDWFFEPIQWEHGGMSWGGSKTAHSRSTFGRLHFTGVDASSQAAVKRVLVVKAKNLFAAACNARMAGEVERWSDPVLGDQDFYLAEVKPLVEKINAVMGLVKKEMTDEDAVTVWDSVGEDAMNIDYLVSLRRTRWLKAKRFGLLK